jgi:hypothetical protein
MFAWRATPAHNVSIPLVVTHTVEGEAAVSNTDVQAWHFPAIF